MEYAHRAQKSLSVTSFGDHQPASGFTDPGVPVRTFMFSPNGGLYAYVLPESVQIFDAATQALKHSLPLKGIIEMNFSPLGSWLSTWERAQKLEDGSQHKNMRIFSTATGEEVLGLSQKGGEDKDWDLQYTKDEGYAIRLAGDVQIYKPGEWDRGVIAKARVEGASAVYLSGGENPSVAVFVKERKGAPASFKVFSLLSLISSGANPVPVSQKTFYKADRATVKWNSTGTQVLLMTQTDVDAANKSYYGETMLYLLSVAGNFDARVTLDREGPIHDFSWSPGGKEFGVVYGFMPSKTTLFSTRLQSLYDFQPAPVNFVSWSPDSRFLILAGFGNLNGTINVYERRNPSKVICKVMAPNTTSCDWSPDGRFLMTSTLSPRLRVDNMIKIWHLPSGNLVHVQEIEELYWSGWRPSPPGSSVPSAIDDTLASQPSEAAQTFLAKLKAKSPSPANGATTEAKPAGAYRPPGARGMATPSIFKREDEGGVARLPSLPPSGTNTPRRSPVPSPNGRQHHVPGSMGYANANGTEERQGKRERFVPGAPPRSPDANEEGGGGGQGKGKKNKNKKGQGQGQGQQQQNGSGSNPRSPKSPNNNANATGGGGGKKISAPTPVPAVGTNTLQIPETMIGGGGGEPTTPDLLSPGADGLDAVGKKVRNLNKKLKAIEELKVRHGKGEKLEATQIRKMEGEVEIRKELEALGDGAAAS